MLAIKHCTQHTSRPEGTVRVSDEEEVFTAFFKMVPPLCHAMSTVPDCDGGREQVRVMLSPGAAVRVEDVRVMVGAAGREHKHG